MNYPRETLDASHRHSINHRKELEQSDICGCFYCGRTCVPAEIDTWTDEGRTALCPHCGIDSVIGSASGYPVNDPQFLHAMHSRWFTSKRVG